MQYGQISGGCFSPRPWGWSVKPFPLRIEATLFPTPVGMVRVLFLAHRRFWSFPHARGDGPIPPLTAQPITTFSPRPWGWSGNRVHGLLFGCLFPTPVGMVRNKLSGALLTFSFPHARGDGPPMPAMPMKSSVFSPRPWGWSAPAACVDPP